MAKFQVGEKAIQAVPLNDGRFHAERHGELVEIVGYGNGRKYEVEPTLKADYKIQYISDGFIAQISEEYLRKLPPDELPASITSIFDGRKVSDPDKVKEHA